MVCVTCSLHILFTFLVSITARSFTTPWCCNRHPGSGFRLSCYFNGKFLYQDIPGRLFYGDLDDPNRILIIPKPKDTKRTRGGNNCRVSEREPLKYLLRVWRAEAHRSDPLRQVRPATYILDDDSIAAVAKILPARLKSLSSGSLVITKVLQETEEWSCEWADKVL